MSDTIRLDQGLDAQFRLDLFDRQGRPMPLAADDRLELTISLDGTRPSPSPEPAIVLVSGETGTSRLTLATPERTAAVLTLDRTEMAALTPETRYRWRLVLLTGESRFLIASGPVYRHRGASEAG